MKRKFETKITEQKRQYEKAMAEFKAKEEAFDEQLRESVSTQFKAERQKFTEFQILINPKEFGNNFSR
ncbi:hypothetical protein SMGD1_2031 [Sulfurimonas gotlandica GD1]|uniref:Uncharacterized protein n=1 Tax=Sulfurimonas gotlandica (strain DSM 19862 / JCM 16533 / GD1) TaxID=929558 RepID=B6BJ39_SULGG|nr:hypothetical protein [Sulfurimonas gotlandica]EDZ63121.1 hypothetical protein CBGD1_740 [Sulfurimonas gotlandica GD1]EHP30554.1 hypothetical protein SMGD1_2031 [Sulfurimonas gotlandica GD1]